MGTESERGFFPALSKVLPAFMATRLALLAVGLFCLSLLPLNMEMASRARVSGTVLDLPRAVQVWARFDSEWYLWIAQRGYRDSTYLWEQRGFQPPYPAPPQAGFPPLYPVLMRVSALATGSSALAGIVISNLCLLLSAWLMVRLAGTEPGMTYDDAGRGAVLFLAFPTSFFLSSIYAESLFVFLVIASFTLARSGRLWPAGLVGFLAALAKPLGFALCLPLLVEWYQARKAGRGSAHALAAPFLCPAGAAAFLYYCHRVFGDALAPVTRQSWWRGGMDWPWETFRDVVNEGAPLGYRNSLWDAFVCIGALVLLVFAFKTLKASTATWAFIAALLPLATGPISYGRLVLSAWPLFLVLGALSRGRPRFFQVLLILSLTFSGLFFTLFSLYNWVD